MAKTLLDGVNEVLKRVQMIAGDSTPLTSLTSESKQSAVDAAVQVINEGIDALYTASRVAKPNGQAESTITLATGTRTYALASDLVRLRWPMIDKTNNQYLVEGDYNGLLLADPEQDDTGQPHWGAISPVNGQLYLDRAPTSNENGRVYTYQYEKDLALDDAADAMPFKDVVFRAMVPAWVQLWKREKRNEFDGDLYNAEIGRAATLLTQKLPRGNWNPRC